jgi:poly(3-hydroxybutyrate) depolymerase
LAGACSGEELPPPHGTGGSTTGGSTTGGSTTGGSTTGGSTTGGSTTGGSTTGGSTTGGSTTGGTGVGGTSGASGSAGQGGAGGTAGAAGSGGTQVGGMAGTSGAAGSGGSGGNGGSGAGRGGMSGSGGAGGRGGMAGAAGKAGGGAGGSGGALPMGNPPNPSAGCGKATTVTTGKKTITSTNQQRTYIIDIPTGYDMNKPYKLFYTSHWIGSTSEAVRDQNYYFLKPLATADNQPAIFVAPQSDGQTWQQKDHALFDDILKFVKDNLCIDTTRVFATGFSFGGMITYSLSTNHAKDIRAAVGIAPANYNIYLPTKTREPIAWMQTTGMGDTTCPWVNGSSTTQGAKFIAAEKAMDNGCTAATVPTWTSGNHLCYDYMGCRPEFPTKICTFNGGHTNIANEGGTNWIATESWAFFKKF